MNKEKIYRCPYENQTAVMDCSMCPDRHRCYAVHIVPQDQTTTNGKQR